MKPQNKSEDEVRKAATLVACLERQHATALGELNSLRAARAPLALPAKLGDKSAQRELDRLADAERLAEVECRDLFLAIEEAQRRLKVAQAAAQEVEANRRFAEAGRITAELLEQSAAIDAAAKAMAAAFASRRAAITKLIRTDVVKQGSLNRLLHRERNQRALAALREDIGFHVRNTDVGKSLEDDDRGFLAHLMNSTAIKEAA